MLAAGGDIGGPVVANNNVVIGMLPPRQSRSAQALTAYFQFAIDSSALLDLAKAADVTIEAPNSTTKRLSPEELTPRAREFTVLMQC